MARGLERRAEFQKFSFLTYVNQGSNPSLDTNGQTGLPTIISNKRLKKLINFAGVGLGGALGPRPPTSEKWVRCGQIQHLNGPDTICEQGVS